jgi:APA family basic amino acid/polyamine antiporter
MSTSSSEKIGVSTATIVGMNAMIGAGIFTISSALAGDVGPAVICSFIFTAVSVWFMARSMARVAQLFPQEGSFYTYAKQWGGHSIGLLANACYLIGLLIAMGLLAHAAGLHLVRYLPGVPASHLGVLSLIGLTLLNIMGVSLSSLGQQILIFCTVFPLIATTIMCLSKANLANLTPFMPGGPISILKASRVIVFSFFGFEASASLFNVIRNPEENLPKALTYALTAVAALYTLFVASLVLAVPLELFQQYPGPVSGPLSHVFPNNKWVLECIHISSISAILGTLHSMIWSSGSLLLTFAKKMRNKPIQLFLAHGILNHRTSTLLIGLAIFTSFKIFTNNMFFYFTAMFLLVALSLSMITLLFIPEEWKSGQNYLTLAGLVTACMIFAFSIMGIMQSV